MTWSMPGIPSTWNPTLREALEEIESHRSRRYRPFRHTFASITSFVSTSSWAFLISTFIGFLLFAYLIDSIPSLFTLKWSRKPKLCPLPEGVRRESVKTWEGGLELLVSEPRKEKGAVKPAILFIHGGFGSAGVWLPWMTHLQASSYPGALYALSLRGHGASFSPSYVELTYLTSMTPLCADISATIKAIVGLEKEAGRAEAGLVIIGHSGGGGLIQYGLGSGKIELSGLPDGKLKGLGLVASIPHFGSGVVYRNWIYADPWSLVRNLIHFCHPRGSLSTTRLVRKAFFSKEIGEKQVEEFEQGMNEFESLQWPLQMMMGEFVEVQDVVETIDEGKVLVMGGEVDKIVRMNIVRRVADEYFKAEAGQGGKKDESGRKDGNVEERDLEGVRLVEVFGSGHHLQNDVHAGEAAEAVWRWVVGL